MKWALYFGKISGIRLYMHWSFVILIIWVILMHLNMGHDMQTALQGVLFVLALFVCVILHEFGHAITGQRFNYQTYSITLLPIGGMAQMKEIPEKPIHELLVAIAGPLVNVVIAGILFIILKLTGTYPRLDDIKEVSQLTGEFFFFNLFVANLILVGFNLLPAFPMDGGRILRALLSMKYPRERATRVASYIGQLLAVLFAFTGMFSGNIWLMIIGVFVFFGARAESSYVTAKSSLEGYSVKDIMMHNFTPLYVNNTLNDAISLLLNGQEKEFIVIDNDQVAGILTKNDIIFGLSEYGKEVSLDKVMKKEFLVLSPDMELTEVYTQMISNNYSICPVIDKNQLTGVLDKENIDELILLKINNF